MKLLERYSQAVNSDNLSVDERTTFSDTDVLGASGLAAKNGHALGVALTRLFADGKPGPVVLELTEMAFKRSRTLRLKFTRIQAEDLSKAVLAYYRHGICLPCGGTGYTVIKGTPVHGDECPHCLSTGRLNFDRQFTTETIGLARWLSGEIDRAQAAAGSAAMVMLAPRMGLT